MQVTLDVDTGVDDALALILALRSPELDVKAITTVAGNAPVEACTRNTLLVLDLLQAPLTLAVAQGAAQPLVATPLTASEVHGADGLGNVSALYPRSARVLAPVDAAELLLRQIREHTGALTLIATGPMTNLALAQTRDPGTFCQAKEIVQMGGAVAVPGNASHVAEFNFYVDPAAAAQVVSSGVPLRLLPLDVTEHLVLLRSELRRLARERDSAVFQFVRECTVLYFDFHQRMRNVNGGYLHDPAAVAAVIRPEWFTWRRARLRVETRAGERGRLRTQWDDGGNAQVATGIKAEGVLGLVCERLCR